jgi:hypothetical protein
MNNFFEIAEDPNRIIKALTQSKRLQITKGQGYEINNREKYTYPF